MKTILVTGATSGIGLATATELAARGHRILLHGRTEAKLAAASQQILDNHPTARLNTYAADLSRQAEVRRLGAAVRADETRLDVLLNNAGVWNSAYELTEDGIETVFATNHLAYFLLTHELYPLLSAAPQGRVINVASDSHKQVKGMQWDDLYLEKNYHGLRSYAQSKLANVLFTYELQRTRTNPNLDAFAVQPGLVQTDIGIKGNTWLHALAWRVRRQMSGHKTPAEGAATSIYLATAPEVSSRGGTYWDDCRPKAGYSSSNDPAEAERLWQESLRLCGLTSFYPTPTPPQ